jgi:hypothetical protein
MRRDAVTTSILIVVTKAARRWLGPFADIMECAGVLWLYHSAVFETR